jgi:hypothetical protein
MNVLLLTNDADNRRKAEAEGLKAMTMTDFGTRSLLIVYFSCNTCLMNMSL